MSDYNEEGAQILRENYRHVIRSVQIKDGAYVVDVAAGVDLPEHYRGMEIRRFDSKSAGATRPGSTSSSTSSTASPASANDPRARMARLREENARLREAAELEAENARLRNAAAISPDEQRELDELEAENARLRGDGH